MIGRLQLSLAVAFFLPAAICAQTLQERFVRLADAQGVSGYEADVRAAVRAQLPEWAASMARVDEIGNLTVTVGSGEPRTILAAYLDEGGYVVSRITDDGYLRLHRHTVRAPHALQDQYLVGQPVSIRTSSGRMVSGVTATPSVHHQALTAASEVARIKTVSDLWVDVGAISTAEVERRGIRVLDAVTLKERAQPLANGRVASVNAQLRGGAQALIEILRGAPRPNPSGPAITFAWVTQSQFGARGLLRLARSTQPQQVVVITRPLTSAKPPPPPAGWEQAKVTYRSIPVLFPFTPVEVVDMNDVAALAAELTALVGWPAAAAPSDRAAATPAAAGPRTQVGQGSFELLRSLIELPGVSGHEARVRDAIRSRLPAWAEPQVDAKGNLTVTFGAATGKTIVFIAHMDEVGFEIASVGADGSVSLRTRGNSYLSLYEAHPVTVHTAVGIVAAIVTPRRDYIKASESTVNIDALSLFFGTRTAEETRALGIAVGQPVTVRKQFIELTPPRAAGRSMDDRAGSAALLLALQQLNPATIKNRVTFAWSVEEELGLLGADALAPRLKPAYAFGVDTFVTSDAPLAIEHLAHAELGKGAVLRVLDGSTIVAPEVVDRIVALAKDGGVPLQLGVTLGGFDSSAFSQWGSIDVGLSWPGRYSHSPVEVIDRRDLEALARLVATLARNL